MKNWIKVLIVVAAAVMVFGLVKDMAIKAAVEGGAAYVTGLKLKTGGFSVGVVRTAVDIKDLKLFNPAGYPDKVMLDMPRIYVSYDLPRILGGTVYLRDVMIDMKEFTVVKNEKGELNLDALKVVKEKKAAAKPAPEEKGKAVKMHIDKLRLKIGKVVYKDYSKGGAPEVQEFNVNLDESYSNIDDPAALVSLIVVKALMNTSIARLTNFDVGGLSSNLQGKVDTATKAAQETASKVTQEASKQVGEAAKQAEETVKNLLPFGKK